MDTSGLRQLLDVSEVAAILQVPVRAVYLLAEDRRLGHYKIGRRLRFDPAQVEQFLDSTSRGPVEP